MTWEIIASREASGALDAWPEYLCVRRNPEGAGWLIAVCGHEILGEPPCEWFDEDGEPLPEFCDADGELKLPDTWNGQIVSHFDGEYIVSGLTPLSDDAFVGLESTDIEAIRAAIRDLEWHHESCAAKILSIVSKASP